MMPRETSVAAQKTIAAPAPPFFNARVAVPRSRGVAAFTLSQIAVLFALLFLIASIPVLTTPLPPLSDYINHLSRMQVIGAGEADENLARFYKIEWQIIPNLIMDLVVPWFLRIMDIYFAGQNFILLTFAVMVSGTVILNRALFGAWSILPLIAFPFLYNKILLYGLMNFLFGIGLALWAMAIWLFLRKRFWPLRLCASAGAVLPLFFCHLFAVGLYGLGLLAIELWHLREDKRLSIGERLVVFVSSGIPFLVVIPLMLASPTLSLSSEIEWEPNGKFEGLTSTVEVYSDIVALMVCAVLAGAAFWAVRRRYLRMHPAGWFLLGAGTAVYLAMPRVLFASYLADQRLPIALAFMIIAFLHLETRPRLVRRGFLAIVLTLLAIRVIEVNTAWASLSRSNLEARESLKRIKPGSTVLVAYGSPSAGDDVRDLGLTHAACLAIIERSALVATAFTVKGKQIMQVRPAYAGLVDSEDGTPPSLAQVLLAAAKPDYADGSYWSNWQADFDYLFLVFTDVEFENPAPDRLKLLHDGERFQLYKIIKP
jgi:hypothetical protein